MESTRSMDFFLSTTILVDSTLKKISSCWIKTVRKLLYRSLLLYLNTKTKQIKPDTKLNTNLWNIENLSRPLPPQTSSAITRAATSSQSSPSRPQSMHAEVARLREVHTLRSTSKSSLS